MKTKLLMGLFLTSLVLVVPTWASTTFTDNSFNLSDYSNVMGGDFNSVSQIANAGPDGSSALQIIRYPTKNLDFFQRDYFINKSFVYDPGVSGAIHSINYSQDYWWDEPSSVLGQTSISDAAVSSNLLILQNDRYYQHTGSIFTKGVWQTGQENKVAADQFSLITDLATFALDPSLHPDFTSGIMQFGMYDGYTLNFMPSSSPLEFSSWDNLSITVNSIAPIPLPAGVWLFGSALLGMLGLKRKRVIG
jgi:hypothetical protein